MTSDQPNPYAAPEMPANAASQGEFDPASLKKIEAIIKDAGQFWLAILLCLCCTGVGAIIIGPWYLVRLMQWSSMSKAHPMLLAPNVLTGSLAQRFQSAKIKLIIGITFGAVTFFLALVLFAVSFASALAN